MMEKLTQLLEEFVLKAIEQTEAALALDLQDAGKLESFTANRDRLFLIIEQITKQVDWTSVDEDRKSELVRRIDYIKKLDERLLVKLQEYRETLKTEIRSTFEQKENIKGYNLSDVKQR